MVEHTFLSIISSGKQIKFVGEKAKEKFISILNGQPILSWYRKASLIQTQKGESEVSLLEMSLFYRGCYGDAA